MATFGLVVGGGPAPGINGVIRAATLAARERGHRVLGIVQGFEWLMKGDIDHVVGLGAAQDQRRRRHVAHPQGRPRRRIGHAGVQGLGRAVQVLDRHVAAQAGASGVGSRPRRVVRHVRPAP